jgi:hypothetical protein
MIDKNVLRTELKRVEVKYAKCSRCEVKCRVHTASTAKNKGRPYTSCPECQHYQFLDEPQCAKCGEYKVKFKARKKSSRPGSYFYLCPMKCKHSFQWVNEAVQEVDPIDSAFYLG